MDGVPFSLLRCLIEQGVTPALAGLAARGTLRPMHSTLPEVSNVAWTSVITGANPGEHAVFGFTDLVPGEYRLRFPNFADVKAEPFWKSLPSGKRSVVLNVPATYPALPLSGVLVSGFVAPDLRRAVYPPELFSLLESLNYAVDVDANLAHTDMGAFLNQLMTMPASRVRLAEHFVREQWSVFVLVFTETDRLHHFLWDAFEDESHPRRQAFFDFYHRIDEAIGRFLSRIPGNSRIVVLSDHGFERLKWEFYVNAWLKEVGYLKFKTESPETIEDIDPKSVAFALDPGRIYLNRKRRFRLGSLSETEAASLVVEIRERFLALTHEDSPVVLEAYRPGEIYSGPFVNGASDLILEAATGFDIKASVREKAPFGRRLFTGKHTRQNAFILGVNLRVPVSADVTMVRRVLQIRQKHRWEITH